MMEYLGVCMVIVVSIVTLLCTASILIHQVSKEREHMTKVKSELAVTEWKVFTEKLWPLYDALTENLKKMLYTEW